MRPVVLSQMSRPTQFLLLSSLQLIVHAFGMVGDKKMTETATNSAMWEKPDVHGGLAAHEVKIRPFFDTLSQVNFVDAHSCLQHLHASHLNHFILSALFLLGW